MRKTKVQKAIDYAKDRFLNHCIVNYKEGYRSFRSIVQPEEYREKELARLVTAKMEAIGGFIADLKFYDEFGGIDETED